MLSDLLPESFGNKPRGTDGHEPEAHFLREFELGDHSGRVHDASTLKFVAKHENGDSRLRDDILAVSLIGLLTLCRIGYVDRKRPHDEPIFHAPESLRIDSLHRSRNQWTAHPKAKAGCDPEFLP